MYRTYQPLLETWELVRTDRPPAKGEVRFIRQVYAATLEQVWYEWAEIVWNGKVWEERDPRSFGRLRDV